MKETEHLIAFAHHDSKTVVRTTVEAKEMDKLVTVMYLDWSLVPRGAARGG